MDFDFVYRFCFTVLCPLFVRFGFSPVLPLLLLIISLHSGTVRVSVCVCVCEKGILNIGSTNEWWWCCCLFFVLAIAAVRRTIARQNPSQIVRVLRLAVWVGFAFILLSAYIYCVRFVLWWRFFWSKHLHSNFSCLQHQCVHFIQFKSPRLFESPYQRISG